METHGKVLLEERDLTFRIRGCVYEVFRTLGAGFLEQVYHKALLHELAVQGLQADPRRALEITYKNNPVGVYVPDILVENRVVVELKAVEALTKIHDAQLLNYMKASGIRVGLLVNFTYPKAQVRRFVL